MGRGRNVGEAWSANAAICFKKTGYIWLKGKVVKEMVDDDNINYDKLEDVVNDVLGEGNINEDNEDGDKDEDASHNDNDNNLDKQSHPLFGEGDAACITQ